MSRAAPIHLTALNVAKAAYPLFKEGKLLKQARPESSCFYRYDGLPCVIGAALPDAAALRFDRYEYPDIESLIDRGAVTTDDAGILVSLQEMHDGCNMDALGDRLRSILLAAGEPV